MLSQGWVWCPSLRFPAATVISERDYSTFHLQSFLSIFDIRRPSVRPSVLPSAPPTVPIMTRTKETKGRREGGPYISGNLTSEAKAPEIPDILPFFLFHGREGRMRKGEKGDGREGGRGERRKIHLARSSQGGNFPLCAAAEGGLPHRGREGEKGTPTRIADRFMPPLARFAFLPPHASSFIGPGWRRRAGSLKTALKDFETVSHPLTTD